LALLYARQSVEISDSTRAGWVDAPSDLVSPLVGAIQSHQEELTAYFQSAFQLLQLESDTLVRGKRKESGEMLKTEIND
jgi:hypothetical protein